MTDTEALRLEDALGPVSVLGASVLADRQLRADDGAQPGLLRGLMKPRRAVHAVGIEQRQRRIAERGRALDERLGQRGALEKAEGRRGVEFDVHGRQSAVGSRSNADSQGQ